MGFETWFKEKENTVKGLSAHQLANEELKTLFAEAYRAGSADTQGQSSRFRFRPRNSIYNRPGRPLHIK